MVGGMIGGREGGMVRCREECRVGGMVGGREVGMVGGMKGVG